VPGGRLQCAFVRGFARGERLAGVSGFLNKGFTVVVRIAVGVCAEVSSCLEDRIAVGRW